ncbi:MAG: DCC1-like thiol-disulfide oxidoreductase family protein [Bacteroidota bacterium]|nr:DCC1-like thiol-disulfide oxidoreductase family protein [Bacteroidota bacterium]
MLQKIINNKVSSKGLGIFRILYGLVLLREVLRLREFRELIFDKVPFFEASEISFVYIFYVWIVTVALLIVGYKTRFVAILNYIIGLFLIGTIDTYEYHMFYAYMGINFIMIFTPVSESYSLDNLLYRINNSSVRKLNQPTEKVSEFYYYLLLFYGIAIVYFDSIFYKLASPLWKDGLGMWLPASMPFVVNVNASWLLNQEMLMKFLGYLTIVFEFVYIFFFWNKYFKWPLLLIGIGLHIGIWILFPIPQFAQAVTGLYFLMLPLDFWDKFKFKPSKKPLIFFYDAECPLCLRTRIVIEFFDVFKRIKFLPVQSNYEQYKDHFKGLSYDQMLDNIYSLDGSKYYSGVDTYIRVLKKMIYMFPIGIIIQIPGLYHIAKKVYSVVAQNRNTERCSEDNCEIGFSAPVGDVSKIKLFKNISIENVRSFSLKFIFYMFLFLQIIVSMRSSLPSNLFGDYPFYKAVVKKTEFIRSTSKSLFGITNHGVFMDNHFNNYNHIIRVDYVEGNKSITLPIIDKNGMPDAYLKNFNWVKWTFRVDAGNIGMDRLKKGIRDFSSHWLHKSEVRYEENKEFKFIIYCKKIDSPKGFEYDFLNRQIAKPWQQVGTAVWYNGEFTPDIKNIEEI